VLTTQTPQNTQPGLLASSKPYWSSLPNVRFVWDTPSPQREKTWITVVTPEISRLAKEFALPWKTLSKHHLARGEHGSESDVIEVGIDVSRPVKQADAEVFVQRCSEMLATHKFDNTVVEVHHSRYRGNLAEQFSCTFLYMHTLAVDSFLLFLTSGFGTEKLHIACCYGCRLPDAGYPLTV